MGRRNLPVRKRMYAVSICVQSGNVVLGCDLMHSTTEPSKIIQGQKAPIPENDIWIAATTKQHQLTLATLDESPGC